MRAIILAIGTELTTGQTVDTNSAHLALELRRRGIEPVEHLTLGDDLSAIANAISWACAQVELVLITGGLGPTADDLTRAALAQTMGVQLCEDPECLAQIERFFARRNRTMTDANRCQAQLPDGARAVFNRVGTAPGIHARVNDADVYALPGVPSEAKLMFAEQIAPHLPAGEAVLVHRLLHTYGQGESDVGHAIRDLMEADGPVTVGTTASAGQVSVRFYATGATLDAANGAAEASMAEVRRRLGSLVVGADADTMASVVGELLRRADQTFATAESCTGGLVGAMVAEVPGCSDYFRGGIIAYHNAIKTALLDVPAETLQAHGAVSEEVAIAMAKGARRRMGSDWAVSLTGIAGPTGGSEGKPVGLVHIALAGPDGTTTGGRVFPGERNTVRLRSALAALNLLRLALIGRKPAG